VAGLVKNNEPTFLNIIEIFAILVFS